MRPRRAVIMVAHTARSGRVRLRLAGVRVNPRLAVRLSDLLRSSPHRPATEVLDSLPVTRRCGSAVVSIATGGVAGAVADLRWSA